MHEGSSNPKKLHRSCFMKTSERGLYQIGHPLINKNTPAVVYARGKGLTADERNFSMLSMNDLVEGIVEMDYGNGNISYGYPKNKLLPYLKWLFEVSDARSSMSRTSRDRRSFRTRRSSRVHRSLRIRRPLRVRRSSRVRRSLRIRQ